MVRGKEVDFLISNPTSYVRFEHGHLAMRLLTLKTLHRGKASNRVGSVVIVPSGRSDIETFDDLRGKRFAAVDKNSFAGWLMVLREFDQRGIDPGHEFRSLTFAGTHERVVKALRDGTADAGCVRSDELERFKPGEFRVIEPIPATADYPLPSSTRLYPEWPLATLYGTPEDVAQKVVIALLELGPDHPESRAAESGGWTIPLNYRSVHELLHVLKLPPYDTEGRFTLGDVVHEYWAALCVAVLLVIALVGATGHVIRLNMSHASLHRSLETQLSERERAERALRESEALYHSLVETLPQNIFRKSLEGQFTFVNRRFCTTIGKSPDQIIGRSDFDFFPAELAKKYCRDDHRVMDGRSTIETVEKHITPDGDARFVQVIKSPLLDTQDEVVGTQCIFWDVTDRKRAEDELERSEQRFSLAVRGSNDGIWDWDLGSGEIYYSPRFKELLGYQDHEIPNTVEAHLSRVHTDDHDRVLQKIRGHLKDRVPFDVEYRLRNRDGEYLWFHARGQAIWDEHGRAARMAGSLSDITSRKDNEEQLRSQNIRLQEMARSERRTHQELKQAQSRMVQTAKLAGLGEMVAGVAHEINNPLSFVSNNVCVMQRDLAEVAELLNLYVQAEDAIARERPDDLARIRELWDRVDMAYTLGNLPGLLNRTRDGLRRIQQIVKDLRLFARLDESDLNEVDLNAGMESTMNIVAGHAKKKQIQIHLDLKPIPLITCYPAKINQVVMNLVSNAIDASPENGSIFVRTDAEDSGVRIEVEDQGTGIDPAVRDRIFDPFFTTKPIGVGTGLGLSISYGIIQDHGGLIEVDTEPGAGTRFTIHLPFKPRPKMDHAKPVPTQVAGLVGSIPGEL